jgi:FkbM family methyltransferase
MYCRIINAKRSVEGVSYRISPFGESGIHIVRDVGKTEAAQIHIARRERHRRYKHGVMAWIDGLAKQYHLDLIDIVPGGVFIDCGANVGEMGLWARARGMDYVAFEPETDEARCCDLNNFDGLENTIRKALWFETTTLTFFRKPETADSSVIEIDGADDCSSVAATRLDDAVDPTSFGRGTRVLKLEAEGAEPEVLRGADAVLPFLDYVVADCGYERGREGAHTFIEVNDHLSERGFRLIQAAFKRVTAIWRNENRAAQ